VDEGGFVAQKTSDFMKGLLEVGKRNIRNAIWRFEDLPPNLEYRDFDPADLDYVKNIAVMWTSGKDSTTALWLIREVFRGRVPMDVIFIDTGFHLKGVYEFRDKIAKEWNLNLVIARNDEVLKLIGRDLTVHVDDLSEPMKKILGMTGWEKDTFRVGENPACCHMLKTCPFQQTLKERGYKAVIESVRWDEQKERSTVSYFAQGSGWVKHVRIRPLPFLTFEETRRLLLGDYGDYGIPRNPLYDEGYTSLGCAPCTRKPKDMTVERGGRAAQKEEMMARLQRLGYHGGETGWEE
jgi:3'-phosphoadenosine 5'-phosphosulfate sulfotransferase (PAPS reductase)/FAD synthetase